LEVAIEKRIPARPPSAEEMNNVVAKIRSTWMPSRSAARGFSATARRARPTCVQRRTAPSSSTSTSVTTTISTRLPSTVNPAMCQVGLGTAATGNRTELAPSCHSHPSGVPACACSTSATMIRAKPMVEISAEI